MVKKSASKTPVLFVEGGGDHNPSLVQEARKGFHDFLIKAGFVGKLPKVMLCGTRKSAYEDYCTAVRQGKPAVLLVDSEAPIRSEFEKGDIHDWKPWEQLRSRTNQTGNIFDNWEKVGEDTDCHLMVQEMESWFLADPQGMKSCFDSKFKEERFPKDQEDIEKISKDRIERIFQAATLDTIKKTYKKGRDSFQILGCIDPSKVAARSKWADRLIRLLHEKSLSLQER